MRDLTKAVHLLWSECRGDSFCRCRACKPLLPTRDEITLARLKVALMLASIGTAAMAAACALGAW